MTNMDTFLIGNMFEEEIDVFERELQRIVEKHTCALAPCEFSVSTASEENGDGSKTVTLHANSFMIEAYIREQVL